MLYCLLLVHLSLPSMYKTLVDCHALALHLHDPEWVVMDCRFSLSDPDAGLRAYQTGHIPGARYAHLNNDLSSPITPTSGRHPLPDPVMLTQRLGQWGIDNHKQVVVYDDSFGGMAARLWWLLRWLAGPRCRGLAGRRFAQVAARKPPVDRRDARPTADKLHAASTPGTVGG